MAGVPFGLDEISDVERTSGGAVVYEDVLLADECWFGVRPG